jgi:hypothetical protein
MRYCAGSSGTAMLCRTMRGFIENEQAVAFSFEFVSAQKSALPDEMTKRNNIEDISKRKA